MQNILKMIHGIAFGVLGDDLVFSFAASCLSEYHTNVPRTQTLWDTQQAIELAEGVEIRLRIAGPVARIWAFLLDLLFLGIGLLIIGFLMMFSGFLVGFTVATGVYLLLLFFAMWLYWWIFEASRWGASFGKRICGLRVTQTTGAPITIGQAAVRNFIRFIDVLPFPFSLIGLASCLTSQRFQRLGDIAAGTLVIYTRAEVMPKSGSVPQSQAKSPNMLLRAEEARAIVMYRERHLFWSDARKAELADHLQGLTGNHGAEGVKKLLGIAQWLQENR